MKLGDENLSFLNWYILVVDETCSMWVVVMKICHSWIDTYFLVDETCSMWVVVVMKNLSFPNSFKTYILLNWRNLVMKLSFLNSIIHTSNWWNLVMKILSLVNSYILLLGWWNLVMKILSLVNSYMLLLGWWNLLCVCVCVVNANLSCLNSYTLLVDSSLYLSQSQNGKIMPFLTLRKTRMNVNPKHEALSIPMVVLLLLWWWWTVH
jgi:hypothetical protein